MLFSYIYNNRVRYNLNSTPYCLCLFIINKNKVKYEKLQQLLKVKRID